MWFELLRSFLFAFFAWLRLSRAPTRLPSFENFVRRQHGIATSVPVVSSPKSRLLEISSEMSNSCGLPPAPLLQLTPRAQPAWRGSVRTCHSWLGVSYSRTQPRGPCTPRHGLIFAQQLRFLPLRTSSSADRADRRDAVRRAASRWRHSSAPLNRRRRRTTDRPTDIQQRRRRQWGAGNTDGESTVGSGGSRFCRIWRIRRRRRSCSRRFTRYVDSPVQSAPVPTRLRQNRPHDLTDPVARLRSSSSQS